MYFTKKKSRLYHRSPSPLCSSKIGNLAPTVGKGNVFDEYAGLLTS